MSVRVAVLASGGGTNLHALLEALSRPDSPAAVALVISDRDDAGALTRAAQAGVPIQVVPFAGRDDEIAADLLHALSAAEIELVALAGFLRRVPAAVVHAYSGRMLNVHPALLPAFGGQGMYGKRVHRAVLEAGCRVSGATVHFVDEEYDTGPILVQWPVPVLAGDTEERLAARVLEVEHRIYPAAVEALAQTLRSGGGGTGAREAAGAEVAGGFRERASLHFGLAGASPPSLAEVREALGLQPVPK